MEFTVEPGFTRPVFMLFSPILWYYPAFYRDKAEKVGGFLQKPYWTSRAHRRKPHLAKDSNARRETGRTPASGNFSPRSEAGTRWGTGRRGCPSCLAPDRRNARPGKPRP